jgi:hypothetical protein
LINRKFEKYYRYDTLPLYVRIKEKDVKKVITTIKLMISNIWEKLDSKDSKYRVELCGRHINWNFLRGHIIRTPYDFQGELEVIAHEHRIEMGGKLEKDRYEAMETKLDIIELIHGEKEEVNVMIATARRENGLNAEIMKEWLEEKEKELKKENIKKERISQHWMVLIQGRRKRILLDSQIHSQSIHKPCEQIPRSTLWRQRKSHKHL